MTTALRFFRRDVLNLHRGQSVFIVRYRLVELSALNDATACWFLL